MPTLDWTGKQDAIHAAEKIPYRLLEFDSALSCGDNSGNLIVHGDNLDALNSLLPFYRARVKCIYIDPPYNTHSAFEHYNDNFEHAAWLSMMYPRLELLRKFLSDDGAIFISIDDNEQAHLKIICDEIFGASNFVATVIWERAYAPVSLKKHFSPNHDYLICYAKNISRLVCHGLPRSESQNKDYKNPDNDPRGAWKAGNPSVGPEVPENVYEIISPSGRKMLPPKGRSWLYSKERFAEMIRDNRIYWGKNGNSIWAPKLFLSEVKQSVTPMTIWKYTEVGHSQDATKALKKIFDGQAVFTYPKPVNLIKRCLELYSDKDSIVLDAFAGSGTTAHAVINLNAADGGNRRFILIERENFCKTITAERVKLVGGNFRYYRLGAKLFDETGAINPAVTFGELAAQIWHKTTGTAYSPPEKFLTLIGIHNGAAYYLIRGELTREILTTLPACDGAKIIFGDSCKISAAALKSSGVTFRQIPKGIR